MIGLRKRQGAPFRNGDEKLLSPGLEETLNGTAGDAHVLGRLLLLLLLEVAEAHRLEFVQSEFDNLELGKRDS